MSQQKFGIGSVPATPESGYVTIYPKSDKRMYGKDANGIEFSLGTISDTDALPEGAANLYFTNERAQDAALGVLADSADIDFTYNDAGNSVSAVLTTSGVSAGTYGSDTQSSVVTVDTKGRVTNISQTPISFSAGALLTGLTESYGFPAATDSILQAIQKLAYTETLQKKVISVDASIPDGHTWLRCDTVISGTATITLLGDSVLKFI